MDTKERLIQKTKEEAIVAGFIGALRNSLAAIVVKAEKVMDNTGSPDDYDWLNKMEGSMAYNLKEVNEELTKANTFFEEIYSLKKGK